jgi:hypothetical protein
MEPTNSTKAAGHSVDPDGPAGLTLDAAESRYMQGTREPVTSSVLISNSKYLNNPYYREAFAQQALRRHGRRPPTSTTCARHVCRYMMSSTW